MRDAADPLADLAARLSDGADFLRSLGGPFRRAIRVHPRRGTPSGWSGLASVPWSPPGFFHDADIDPGDQLDYHTGCAYPQDAASQAPVALLAPRPGETIVDCCAAPGSKATQIGLALGDDGLVVCCDASPPRRRVLAENLARQGVACALVTPMPLHVLAERHPGCADGVLVDAPCSGHEQRSAKQCAAMGRRQGALLASAARLVRPGGRLVYSTCTPYAAEDEEVVVAFLAAHPAWTVRPAALPGTDPDLAGNGGLRLWPHRQGCEPFFACLLVAPGEEPAERSLAGDLPAAIDATRPWLPMGTVHCWRWNDTVFIGSRQAAACRLPSDARGLILGRGEALRLDPWGAQALIERGASATAVDHADACRLWAGGVVPAGLSAGMLVKTIAGAPLGMITGADDGLRLDLPSRMRRADLR